MNKILYTAIDQNEKEQTNYIEADNNKQAIELLKSQGFTNIVLYDNASFTVIKNELLEGKSDWELKRSAKFELKSRKDNSLFSFLQEIIILNWWFILIGLIIAVLGYSQNRSMTLVFGIIMIIVMPIISTWRRRHLKRYNRIAHYYSFGKWDDALREIKTHRKFKRFPDHMHDLDFREASILAKLGKLDQALDLVSKWQNAYNTSNPGYYESRLSGVYDSAGNEEMCLTLMNECYNKSTDKMFSTIDLSMIEARYGDDKKSIELLKNINLEELPIIAHAYNDWINGTIAMRNNKDANAKIFLEKALIKLLERQGEILSEPSIAICSGELALVLNRLGNTNDAKELISKVSIVLKAHGYKSLLKEIGEFTVLK